MKVKLKTGFWEVREYELTLEDEAILFHSDQNELRIPFAELTRFSLTGTSACPDRFTLETQSGCYDGRFADAGDGKEFISQLSKQSRQKAEICLTLDRPDRREL